MIYYTCGHCKTELEVEDIFSSKIVHCPICTRINNIPKSRIQIEDEFLNKKKADIAIKSEQGRKIKQSFEETLTIGTTLFNLFKRRIETSMRVKTFRVGILPNGKSYIHKEEQNHYDQQDPCSDKGSIEQQTILTNDTKILNRIDKKTFKTSSSQELIPQSRADLLININKSYNETRLDFLCGVIFIVVAFFCFSLSVYLGLIAFIMGVIATVFITRRQVRGRTIVINYDFKDGSGEHFKKIISAFKNLASNSHLWSMINSRNIYGTHESKLNAGAGRLINTTAAKIGEGKPPWLETNIDVLVLITQGQSLYIIARWDFSL